ncbi:alpha/beta hydrolase [Pseudonocardia sp. RS010]|uniref:alpha/beta hydrolase n=1 Tax=Pseudonocardia sp. RS010 TaxID=3385979 RepID=UPI0039A0286A
MLGLGADAAEPAEEAGPDLLPAARDMIDTIVLIHGFCVTPRSWEHWVAHYDKRGFRVLAPGYPSLEEEVEALNADPAPVEAITIPGIVEHLESVVQALDTPLILIGHSAGGVFTQLLMDKGYGAAGVALNAKHYRSEKTLTRVPEFSGMPHLLPAVPGREDAADYVPAWALRHARA